MSDMTEQYVAFGSLFLIACTYYPPLVGVLAVVNMLMLSGWNYYHKLQQYSVLIVFIWLVWYLHSIFYPLAIDVINPFFYSLANIAITISGLSMFFLVNSGREIPTVFLILYVLLLFVIPPVSQRSYVSVVAHSCFYVLSCCLWIYLIKISKKYNSLPTPVITVINSAWILFTDYYPAHAALCAGLAYQCYIYNKNSRTAAVLPLSANTVPTNVGGVLGNAAARDPGRMASMNYTHGNATGANKPPIKSMTFLKKPYRPNYQMKSMDPLMKRLRTMQDAVVEELPEIKPQNNNSTMPSPIDIED